MWSRFPCRRSRRRHAGRDQALHRQSATGTAGRISRGSREPRDRHAAAFLGRQAAGCRVARPHPYFATSFAEGDSLDVALKQFGPAALPDLVPRVRALAGVLDAAASRGILHGALHPRDVTVSESETTLTGLGVWPILAVHGERLPIRRPYRAPELGEGAITAAGDQFSLAALAYEWMTSRRAPSAFVGGDMAPVPGADREALATIFARALHPDPRPAVRVLRRVRHRVGRSRGADGRRGRRVRDRGSTAEAWPNAGGAIPSAGKHCRGRTGVRTGCGPRRRTADIFPAETDEAAPRGGPLVRC